MGIQIHKRFSREFVEEVLGSFNERRITEEMACELLGIKRARLYRMRRDWLRSMLRGEDFKLWDRKERSFHVFSEEVEGWLRKELRYIRSEAGNLFTFFFTCGLGY